MESNIPVLKVKKARGPNRPFNLPKEMDTFIEARREFTTNDAKAFTSKNYGDPRKNCDEGLVLSIPQVVPTTTETHKKVSFVMAILNTIQGLLKNVDAISELSKVITTYEKLFDITLAKESSLVVIK